jgi:hypothetical protein
MERYFINWIPFVIAVALVLLALPWLGVIALMVFVLAAFAGLAALAWAIVAAPLALGRAIGLLPRGHDVVVRPQPALSLVEHESASVSIAERRARATR